MHSTLRVFKLLDQGLIKSLYKTSNYSFSSAASVATNNFNRFKQQYHDHVSAFKDKLADLESTSAASVKQPTTKAYTHPYHSDHHPLVFSPVKTAELFHDFIGPEQVSPHYENFMMSRKYLLTFWAGFFVLNFGVATVDLQWIAKSSFIPWIFWFQIMYFYMEGRKSMLKPLLQRFYRRAAANEIYTMEVFYHENIENKLRHLIRVTKGQLDYWNIHKNYNDIKAESVNNFLANEYINLQKHITDRALNVLRTTQQYEEMNRNAMLQKILDDALAILNENIQKDPEVQKSMLDIAINGLAEGQMSYANDPLLPKIIASIEKNVASIQNLSAEEQAKLISLTAEQLKSIREDDKNARIQYLTKEPKGIDGSLKNNEAVKKIMDSWGQ